MCTGFSHHVVWPGRIIIDIIGDTLPHHGNAPRLTQGWPRKGSKMSPSINDPHLIIVSGDSLMAWPLLNSCGSVFFLGIFFVHSKIISLSTEACPWNTFYELELFHPGILSYANSRKSNKLLSQEEREGGKKREIPKPLLGHKNMVEKKKSAIIVCSGNHVSP